MSRELIRKLLNEPLVQFLLIGSAIYGVLSFSGDRRPLVIDEARFLESRLKMTSLLDPTGPEAERNREADSRVIVDELLYREALRRGMEVDDPVVRQHLAQKMLTITEELHLASRRHSEAKLQKIFDELSVSWASPPRMSFCHFYSRAGWKRGDIARITRRRSDCKGVRSDAFALGAQFSGWTRDEIEARFGAEFSAAVFDARPGAWVGPVESAYGSHLVLVLAKEAGAPADFASRRADVVREWERREREIARTELLKELVDRYRPRPAPETDDALRAEIEVALAHIKS